jgi:hypothetical protein
LRSLNCNQSGLKEDGVSNLICPFCAEEIKDEAKLCRFCGKEFPIDSETSILSQNRSNTSMKFLLNKKKFIIGLVFVSILGSSSYFVLLSNKKNENLLAVCETLSTKNFAGMSVLNLKTLRNELSPKISLASIDDSDQAQPFQNWLNLLSAATSSMEAASTSLVLGILGGDLNMNSPLMDSALSDVENVRSQSMVICRDYK